MCVINYISKFWFLLDFPFWNFRDTSSIDVETGEALNSDKSNEVEIERFENPNVRQGSPKDSSVQLNQNVKILNETVAILSSKEGQTSQRNKQRKR